MFYCQRCTRVHKKTKKDNLGRKCCPECGWIKGDPIVPTTWSCEECGLVDIDHGTNKKPICSECGSNMSALSARPSTVRGIGTGDKDLDRGLAILLECQA